MIQIVTADHERKIDLALHGEGGNAVAICSTEGWVWEREARKAAEIVQSGKKKVAIIGNGFGILARLLPSEYFDVTIYEIHEELAAFNFGHAVVIGDFRETIKSASFKYDVIVNDTGISSNGLEKYLAEDGKIIE